jgi:hypothetical protein
MSCIIVRKVLIYAIPDNLVILLSIMTAMTCSPIITFITLQFGSPAIMLATQGPTDLIMIRFVAFVRASVHEDMLQSSVPKYSVSLNTVVVRI